MRKLLPAAGLLLITLIIVGGVYGLLLPGLLKKESSLQIRAAYVGQPVPDGFYLYQKLGQSGIVIKSITPAEQGLIVHLEHPEQQDAARRVLYSALPPGFRVAAVSRPPSLLLHLQERLGRRLSTALSALPSSF